MRHVGDADIRQAYFGDGFETKSRDPKASPVLSDLKGVAPVIIGVGPHDFLYQDNLAFADALRAAKVPLTFREFPTLNHGFFGYTAISPASAAAADQLCDDLRELMR
jgi:acetyl esterase/lipase